MFETDDFKNAEMKYLAVWKFDSTNTELNLNLAICKYKLRELPDSVLYYLKKAGDKLKVKEAIQLGLYKYENYWPFI